jgi:hypothetical protein
MVPEVRGQLERPGAAAHGDVTGLIAELRFDLLRGGVLGCPFEPLR